MKIITLCFFSLALLSNIASAQYPSAADEIKYQMATARAEKAEQDRIVAEQRSKEAEAKADAAQKALDKAEKDAEKAAKKKAKKDADEKERDEKLDELNNTFNNSGYIMPYGPDGEPVVIDPRIAPYVRLLQESRLHLKNNLTKLQEERNFLIKENVKLFKQNIPYK